MLQEMQESWRPCSTSKFWTPRVHTRVRWWHPQEYLRFPPTFDRYDPISDLLVFRTNMQFKQPLPATQEGITFHHTLPLPLQKYLPTTIRGSHWVSRRIRFRTLPFCWSSKLSVKNRSSSWHVGSNCLRVWQRCPMEERGWALCEYWCYPAWWLTLEGLPTPVQWPYTSWHSSEMDDAILWALHRDSRQVLHHQLASGHFKDCINFTPYRQFNGDGHRTWSNLMSADWSWKQAVRHIIYVSLIN